MMSDFLQLMTWQFQFNNNNNENNDKDKFPFTSLIGEMSCPQKIWSAERRILPNVFMIKTVHKYKKAKWAKGSRFWIGFISRGERSSGKISYRSY